MASTHVGKIRAILRVMTGRYIAQVNLQSKTHLAKDRFVNTFHFLGSGEDVGADCLDIAIRLADFFNGGAVAEKLNIYLPDTIDPTVTLNIYDFNTAKPRVPYTFHFVLDQGGAGKKALPEEIALCLSFFSIRNTPTTRNRIYFGPLNEVALGVGGATVTARPAPTLIDALTKAGTRLAASSSGGALNASNWVIDGLFLAGLAGLPGAPSLPSFLLPQDFPASSPTSWVVHSPIGIGTKAAPQDLWGFVTGGWVDNEWDGQDRRRVDASARSTFTA